MKSMEEYALTYQKQHRGRGRVSDITSYSFKWTTLPMKENEQPKSYYVMISYFVEFN